MNPNYPPPPATPAQIDSIKNEIVNLLNVRATAEQEAEHQATRADQCDENRGPIQQSVNDTTAGISAVQAHDQAVARHQAVNQEQQQREQESHGLTSGYPNRATGLTVLRAPLAAWEGFTSLASHLPGDAGDSMMRMNSEAQQMQQAFDQMEAQTSGVDSGGAARESALGSDQARLEAADQQAQSSDEQLHTASEGASALQQHNEATFSEASNASAAATERADQCTEAASEREQQATSLAQQLQTWAQTHQAARQQAVAETEARLEGEGRRVVRSSPQ